MLEMIRKMRTAYNMEHCRGRWADALHMSVLSYSELCLELNIYDLREIEGLKITTYHVQTRFVGIGGPS